jgi:hypothetical protein
MEKSTDYKYYSFDPENSILYHEVNDENFGNKESFITSLSYFVTLIEQLKPKTIIIKIDKKPSYFEFELKNYMEKTLHRTLEKVGIKKVAFHLSSNEYFEELKKQERDDLIKVKFFLDLESAKQWALS